MLEEVKAIDFKIVDGFLVIKADPNKNGISVLEIKVNLAEVPAEIVAILKK
jgi:hypothetical protein